MGYTVNDVVNALNAHGANVSFEYPGFIAAHPFCEATGQYAWTVEPQEDGAFAVQTRNQTLTVSGFDSADDAATVILTLARV